MAPSEVIPLCRGRLKVTAIYLFATGNLKTPVPRTGWKRVQTLNSFSLSDRPMALFLLMCKTCVESLILL